MIGVVITHCLGENQKLLDECLESLSYQVTEFETLVISDADEPPKVPEWCRLHHEKEKTHFAYKINKGIKLIGTEVDYYLIGSDDIVFGKDSLKNMAELSGKHSAIVNAMSNCDDLNFLGVNFEIGGIEVDKLKGTPNTDAIRIYQPSSLDILVPTNRLNFYATLVPSHMYYAIGPLDENFESGWEDEDYCIRASEKGFKCGIALNSFIFHHGGRTVDKLPKEPRSTNNLDKFKLKYGTSFIPSIAHKGFGYLFYRGVKQLNIGWFRPR